MKELKLPYPEWNVSLLDDPKSIAKTIILSAEHDESVGKISDGYHTFDELYDHRITLFIALCRTIREWQVEEGTREFKDDNGSIETWRSKFHSDGTNFDGWFTLGIGKTRGTQITYHLPLSRWEETDFAETLEKAPPWDGHTSSDVLGRLKTL